MSDYWYEANSYGQVVQLFDGDDGHRRGTLLSHAMPLQQAEAIARLLNWCVAKRDLERAAQLETEARRGLLPFEEIISDEISSGT